MMCEILPGHTYLLPLGSKACLLGRGWPRCELVLCELARRHDARWLVATYAHLTKAAAREARAGHRKEANRLMALGREVMERLELNPCAAGAMIEVTP